MDCNVHKYLRWTSNKENTNQFEFYSALDASSAGQYSTEIQSKVEMKSGLKRKNMASGIGARRIKHRDNRCTVTHNLIYLQSFRSDFVWPHVGDSTRRREYRRKKVNPLNPPILFPSFHSFLLFFVAPSRWKQKLFETILQFVQRICTRVSPLQSQHTHAAVAAHLCVGGWRAYTYERHKSVTQMSYSLHLVVPPPPWCILTFNMSSLLITLLFSSALLYCFNAVVYTSTKLGEDWMVVCRLPCVYREKMNLLCSFALPSSFSLVGVAGCWLLLLQLQTTIRLF